MLEVQKVFIHSTRYQKLGHYHEGKKKKEADHTHKNSPPSLPPPPFSPPKNLNKISQYRLYSANLSLKHRKDQSLAQPHHPTLIIISLPYLLFSFLLFSGKQGRRSIMKVKSKKYCAGYLDKPGGENCKKGILK